MSQMVNEPLLTYAEAARYCDVSRQYIQALARRGKVSVVTLNRRGYITLNSARSIKGRREAAATSKQRKAS